MYSASAFGVGAAWYLAMPEKTMPSVTPEIPATSAPLNAAPPPPAAPQKKVYADKRVEMGGKKFTVSAAVLEAFDQSRIPSDALIALCGRESDCDPTQVNPKSGAMGLFQFLPNTLYETLYKYGAQQGYAKEAQLVERYRIEQKAKDKKQAIKGKDANKPQATEKEKEKKPDLPVYGYRPINETAKAIIAALALNPLFNTKMHDAYSFDKAMDYMKWRGGTMTHGELTVMNNLGLRGTKLFVGQADTDIATGKSTLAKKFFEDHKKTFGNVQANVTLLMDEKKKPITVVRSLEKATEFGGKTKLELKPQPPK